MCAIKLAGRLTRAIKSACMNREDVSELSEVAWTIFAELIGNVFDHSDTPIDGFAALQVYKKGNCLKVAVSDSGRGLLDTLRPSLKTEYPRLSDLSDMELLVEVFRRGISRHGSNRGCGLKGSAEKAIKFHAELDVCQCRYKTPAFFPVLTTAAAAPGGRLGSSFLLTSTENCPTIEDGRRSRGDCWRAPPRNTRLDSSRTMGGRRQLRPISNTSDR
jgi:hypothetical protein